MRNILTLGSCAAIAGAEVMSFDDERDLLKRWTALVLETDPDVIIGARPAAAAAPAAGAAPAHDTPVPAGVSAVLAHSVDSAPIRPCSPHPQCCNVVPQATTSSTLTCRTCLTAQRRCALTRRHTSGGASGRGAPARTKGALPAQPAASGARRGGACRRCLAGAAAREACAHLIANHPTPLAAQPGARPARPAACAARSRVRMREAQFSSKAYGTHEYKDLTIEGRVQFDLLMALQVGARRGPPALAAPGTSRAAPRPAAARCGAAPLRSHALRRRFAMLPEGGRSPKACPAPLIARSATTSCPATA